MVSALEKLTVYADFFYTQQHLEAGRNRVLNGLRLTDKSRIRDKDLQEILQLTTSLYDTMFRRGKEVVSELSKHLEAAVTKKDDESIQLAKRWAKELNIYNRRAMMVVYSLSDYLTEHPPANEQGPVPIPNVNAPLKFNEFFQTMTRTWESVR